MRRISLIASGSALTLTTALLAVPTLAAGSAQHDVGSVTPTADASAESSSTRMAPRLRVRKVVTGLDIPWDLEFLPSGAMLYTERDRERLWWRSDSGRKRVILESPDGMWHSGETGLMAVAVARNFKQTRHIYTCSGWLAKGKNEVRVMRWRLNAKATEALRDKAIVKGLPSSSGRHGGCALAFGKKRSLFIGTGDAAIGTNPQRLKSGGGKVLRVDRRNGRGFTSNPYGKAANAMKRRVFTYGHRNVQGLARRADGTMWSVEHGSFRDDEVNRLRKGGNYGWNPVPGYNESVPMTDHSLPGKQRGAAWRSGNPTIAPSGAAWLRGKKWGRWNGALAMSVLADQHLRVLRFSKAGKHIGGSKPAPLDGRFGRLRGAVSGPGGALYLTTSNGGGDDMILRVTPRR